MGYVEDVINRCRTYDDETEWFEYKKDTAVSRADDIGPYISALSNGAVMHDEPYGYLIWGIHNRTHEIIGTTFNYAADTDDGPLEQMLNVGTEPSIYFHFDEDIVEGKRVVVLTIPAARLVPTAYKGERFIRVGSSKVNVRKNPAREAELFRILNEQQNPTVRWELQKSKYHISDINMPVFQKYLKTAKELGRITMKSDDPKEVLNGIDVADGDALLNAGAAIFVDSGINELQMVIFASDERLTILDSNRLTGSILGLTDQAILYISKAMDWRAEFDGSPKRIEIPEVPVKAIREAVINAFAHRMIESRQAVEVAIFKSYIEVFSPGVFPQDIEPEKFINQSIRPPRRNPLITKTLYYSKDMEAMATGLRRIDSECATAGVKYEFIREPYGFTVRFYRHCGEGWSSESYMNQHQDQHHGSNSGADSEVDGVDWEERKQMIVRVLKNDPSISRGKISKETGLTVRQVERALNLLKDEKRIKREGPAHGGRWIVSEENG